MKKRTKVAIVVSHPIQHFCPLYRALAAEGSVDIRVLFASTAGVAEYFDPSFGRSLRWQDDLLDGYASEFLPGAEETGIDKPVANPHLAERLSAFDPDVVVVYGYYHPISRRALSWAKRNGRRSIMVSDSERRWKRGILARARRRLVAPWMLRGVDGFLTVGDCNEAFYASYGVARHRFFRCPFTVDEARLNDALANRDSHREQIRARFGIPQDAPVALTVGKLTVRKAPADPVLALSRIQEEEPDFPLFLLILGDGPERGAVEALIEQSGVRNVVCAGFIEVAELPAFYAAADLLIHPSSADPHPLVISEAIFSGLPVIASDRVGSVGPSDDVRIGENGLEYEFGNVDQLAASMRRLVDDGELRESFSRASQRIAGGRTMRASVAGFISAVTGDRAALPAAKAAPATVGQQ